MKEITKETRNLMEEMAETLHSSEPKGIGLAAPQVGISKQLAVIDLGEGPLYIINPRIVEKKGKQQSLEGCLSIPGLYGEVERAQWVKVRALNKEGKTITIEGDELLATVLQHEIDHLQGILIIDRIQDFQTIQLMKDVTYPPELIEILREKVGKAEHPGDSL